VTRGPATLLTAAASLLALALTSTGCGVPTGEDTFSQIPPAEVPFGLAATSTSTTTTTLAPSPDTTTAASTTTPIRLDPAEVYFLSRGRLQPVVIELPPGFSADQVADVLEAGPPPDVGLDTLIEDGLIVSSSEARAVLTVDLDGDTFAEIPNTQQTEAIAQIVLTMISSLSRIGLVNFTIEDELIAVKKGNSLLSDVGEPLAYEDYSALLVNPPLPPPSDVTTTDPDDDSQASSTTTP